jgi:rRNA maturation endonuclease Nob1
MSNPVHDEKGEYIGGICSECFRYETLKCTECKKNFMAGGDSPDVCPLCGKDLEVQ